METNLNLMDKFKIIFLKEAREFLLDLDEKSRHKIIFNMDKAKIKNDKELFKKLQGEIWEFRTMHNKTFYRIFAFWDKTEKEETFVLATHGIVKKTRKIPDKEIGKAEKIRLDYFKYKNEENGK
ncbi:MAG: type II toxin-antitoxin system RelE/ParE family toxin [Prevotellaceae bacterium]|jgi:phage-related protein|nr:type II toxin-antitoxin system RelE/ParE family toxin [Prevotellaceae bacterium]